MSTTVFHRLLSAVANHLQASPLLAGVPVEPNRTRPVPKDVAGAVDVRLGSSRALPITYSYNEWTTVIAVDCMGRATATADAHTTADALLAACYAASQSFADSIQAHELAVTDMAGELAVEAGFDAEDTTLTVLTLQLAIKHQTEQNTLEPRQ